MISKEQMMDAVLDACPSFRPQWEAFLSEWSDEEELPLYLALADLARHLIQQLESGDNSSFQAVFGIVERWHIEGDAYVREAATVGLLEDLQNEGLYRKAKPGQFREHLGNESRRWWDKLLRFWEGRGTLSEQD